MGRVVYRGEVTEVCSDFSMVLQRVIVLLNVSALLATSVREEEDIGDLEQDQDMEMEEERKEQSIYVSTSNFPDHSVEPIKGKKDGTI